MNDRTFFKGLKEITYILLLEPIFYFVLKEHLFYIIIAIPKDIYNTFRSINVSEDSP